MPPTTTTGVDPDVFLTHAGVTVFETYEDGDYDQGPDTYVFTTDPELGDGDGWGEDGIGVFDVRELTTWAEPAYPIYKNDPGGDAPANTIAWDVYHKTGEPTAIRNAVIAAIEKGLLKNPAGFETPSGVKDSELAVYFDPEAVREHCEGGKINLSGVTDDDLREAAKDAPLNGNLWGVLGPMLTEIGEDAKRIRRGKVLTGTSPGGAT